MLLLIRNDPFIYLLASENITFEDLSLSHYRTENFLAKFSLLSRNQNLGKLYSFYF